jgi:hypothetical protein
MPEGTPWYVYVIAGLVVGVLVAHYALPKLKASPSCSTCTLTAPAENLERWEWEDYRGRKRTITVKRVAK